MLTYILIAVIAVLAFYAYRNKVERDENPVKEPRSRAKTVDTKTAASPTVSERVQGHIKVNESTTPAPIDDEQGSKATAPIEATQKQSEIEPVKSEVQSVAPPVPVEDADAFKSLQLPSTMEEVKPNTDLVILQPQDSGEVQPSTAKEKSEVSSQEPATAREKERPQDSNDEKSTGDADKPKKKKKKGSKREKKGSKTKSGNKKKKHKHKKRSSKRETKSTEQVPPPQAS